MATLTTVPLLSHKLITAHPKEAIIFLFVKPGIIILEPTFKSIFLIAFIHINLKNWL
jgi:hypothetical protein